MAKYKSFSLPGAKHPISLKFADDDQLFVRVGGMTSAEIRQAVGFGSYKELLRAAATAGLTPHRLMIERLAKSVNRPPREYSGWPAGSSERLDELRRLLSRLGARKVLDPFGGRADYAIAAAEGPGVTSLYCETSPVFRFLAKSRVAALGCSAEARERIGGALTELATRFEREVRQAAVDPLLDRTRSVYFETQPDRSAGELLMRTRSVIDTLPRIAAAIAACAVVEALPRTPRELERSALIRDIGRELHDAALFLRHEPPISRTPILVAEDARDLALIDPLGIDCLVTNPPSLNFASYNIVSALWFLGFRGPRPRRLLDVDTALATIRSAAPAAGAIRSDVRKIARADERMARIAGNYFAEMAAVFGAIAPHLLPRAAIVLDVHGSTIGGVAVDTRGHLATMFAGFRAGEEGRFLVLRR